MSIRLESGFRNINNFLFITLVFVCGVLQAEIHSLRGVSIARISLYNPERDFTCFDGSLTIPFLQVNDDYCDCLDGSDEPGTSACLHGTFYCENLGHKSIIIRSSMVNDKVCDCCDGSDEYSTIQCPNNCYQLGKAAKEEAVKLAEQLRIGNKIRLELSQKGVQIKKEKRDKLAELQRNRDEAILLQKEKEALKVLAEEAENAALEVYRKIEEEQKREREEIEAQNNRNEATEIFIKFDSDQNGKLHISELQVRHIFDQDHNGEVSIEEAKFFLNDHEEVDVEVFIEECWSKIKPFLMSEQGLFQPPTKEDTETLTDSDQLPDEPEQNLQDDEEDDNLESEDEPQEQEQEAETNEEASETQTVAYDEETQHIVEKAKEARNEYTMAENAVRTIESEIRDTEEYLEKDFGPDEDFATLQGQCFEYADHEYIYKLCPFDKTVQQPKSNAMETRLGVWSGWGESPNSPYQLMIYDRGQSCWNGPQRITKVNVSCGSENKILSVSEPNRCEYYFEFTTPAACRPALPSTTEELHDEL